ncbi:AraC family transcriptional regulator [Pedobacter polaris]|uniref:AraC family transcriptional regulator n=1 Tax=Pedobacter polaris TaxID=2571273 RepID=A0A4U1CQ11_9SPHI|nr:helix-turn-helix domain-containing protein [Pedobacter polaris]TKC10157.1 AraC family transcriptional regulator [Pedobacter polaris]
MKYHQYPVHPALQNWIRYFWSYEGDTTAINQLHIRSFADCYPRLIFQDIASFSPVKNGNGDIMPICYLSGLDTKPSDGFWESRFSHFGVSFFPHALHALFRIDASEITNETPDILALDKTIIPQILLATTNNFERVTILSKYFYDRLFDGKNDKIINDLIHQPLIYQLSIDGNLGNISDYYNISERQMQRKFKQNVGVSPGKFFRLQKFEKALKLLPSIQYGTLTQLAYDLGYADQSHFISDFKSFSGLSPYEFMRKPSLGSESASFIYAEQSS